MDSLRAKKTTTRARKGAPPVQVCMWFLRCREPAVTTVPHPILGEVPCCQRCADFARS